MGVRYRKVKGMKVPSVLWRHRNAKRQESTGGKCSLVTDGEPGDYGKEAWGCKMMDELPSRYGGRAWQVVGTA